MYNTFYNSRLTAASFLGLQTFAGPLGQQSIFGCLSGSATDLVWLLWLAIICCLLQPQLIELSVFEAELFLRGSEVKLVILLA